MLFYYIIADVPLCSSDPCLSRVSLMFSLKPVFLPPPDCFPRMSTMYLFMTFGVSFHIAPRYAEWWVPAARTQSTRDRTRFGGS